MNPDKAILIAGPTASGKSSLAMRLAKELGGTIINADSMQVYRELRILSARPAPAEVAAAPHALYGHVAGVEAYSAARFAAEARSAITAARAAGTVPIVVGGTGLYFKALLEGLAPVPPVPPDVRAHWRAEAGRVGPEHLHQILASRDPAMAARLSPTDPQRLARALEVLDATGRSLADWQQEPGTPVLCETETVRLVVSHPRDELRRRADARFDAMMDEGALEEADALRRLALDPALPVMRALGVRSLIAHLEGRMGRETAVAEGKAETRQYLKRQETWLRRNMVTWKAISTQQMERHIGDIVAFINRAA